MCKALCQLGISKRIKILSLLLRGERLKEAVIIKAKHRKNFSNIVQKILMNKTGNVGMASYVLDVRLYSKIIYIIINLLFNDIISRVKLEYTLKINTRRL